MRDYEVDDYEPPPKRPREPPKRTKQEKKREKAVPVLKQKEEPAEDVEEPNAAEIVRLRRCPSCRTKNQGDAYKCRNCGALTE